MIDQDVLYLGSKSAQRQKLLSDAAIPFKILEHNSDEIVERSTLTFHEYVIAIAQSKMLSLALPDPKTVPTNYLFVLTADTLIRLSKSNKILGKVSNKKAAHLALKQESSEPLEVATGCNLEKFYIVNGAWKSDASLTWATSAFIEFIVPDESIDQYLTLLPHALQCCGAAVAEGFGASFLKSINGSYTATLGLPLFELRAALKQYNFKF